MADSPILRGPHGAEAGQFSPSIASISSPPGSPPALPRQSRSTVTFADQITNSPPPTLHAFDFENEGRPQGLGIIGRIPSLPRVPVGSRSPLSSSTPAKPILSTPSTVVGSPYTPASQSNPFLSPDLRGGQHTYSFDGSDLATTHEEEVDLSTGQNTPYDGDPFADRLSGERTRRRDNISPSIGDGDDFYKMELQDGCPSKHDIHSSRRNWLSVSILVLSIYSTVLSGLYLVIAMMQPRYGRIIMSGDGARLAPETASVLFALFAKTIELSFVSVFVAFLGQVLSRRSLIKASRGVTIAELTMRNWVIQPAFMITHWETLKHAGLTFLGLLTLTNGFMAMLYTTASDSLVSPHLKFGAWHDKTMYGVVKTPYAVPNYVKSLCHNPTTSMDMVEAGDTCLSVLHAGQAHSNHITFLDDWTQLAAKGPVDTTKRPQAPGMLFDNTTVVGSWISKEWSNLTWTSNQFGRIVDNVTMAMPHAGVFAAARHQRNGILQPENLGGVGEYRVKAAVVSPAVNVLCVNLNETELAPLVYITWPNANFDTGALFPGQRLPKAGGAWMGEARTLPGTTFFNRTVVDDIFEWGPNYQRQPPAFPMYPIQYNSITNGSIPYALGDSVYTLFKAPNEITTDYTLCRLRSGNSTIESFQKPAEYLVLSPDCSTYYSVSGMTGGQLRSICDDKNDKMAYREAVPDAPATIAKDWMNVGSGLLTALALGTGISNANAASSRLISQLITKVPKSGPMARNSSMPSISESLAVMAGSSLLLSSVDAAFIHFWNFTSTDIDPIEVPFEASIQSQEYASGFVARWNIVFYLILLVVFATNVFCLVYFFLRSGLVTDFSEPQNLFALAVNSPISRRLFGSCGAGPEGKQFNIDWHVMTEDDSGHFFIKEGERDVVLRKRSVQGRSHPRPGHLKSVASYSKLSTKRRTWL